jgi:hypothetical protein
MLIPKYIAAAELEKDPAAKQDGSALTSTPLIDITAADEDGLEELDFDRGMPHISSRVTSPSNTLPR